MTVKELIEQLTRLSDDGTEEVCIDFWDPEEGSYYDTELSRVAMYEGVIFLQEDQG